MIKQTMAAMIVAATFSTSVDAHQMRCTNDAMKLIKTLKTDWGETVQGQPLRVGEGLFLITTANETAGNFSMLRVAFQDNSACFIGTGKGWDGIPEIKALTAPIKAL